MRNSHSVQVTRVLSNNKPNTLTVWSQEADTMVGTSVLGLNLTQLTHFLCPSPWSKIVYLHSPSAFHSLIVPSQEADTIWRLSVERATERTSFLFVCPTKCRLNPVARSLRRSSPSQLPKSANCPSKERTMSSTKWEWGEAALSKAVGFLVLVDWYHSNYSKEWFKTHDRYI